MTDSNRLPVLATKINEAHRGACAAARTSLRRAIDAGEHLIEAKSLVGHGQWLRWIKTNCEFSDRTAQVYIKLAANKVIVAPESAASADLTLAGALAAVSKPSPRRPAIALSSPLAEPGGRMGIVNGRAGMDVVILEESVDYSGFYWLTHIFVGDDGARPDNSVIVSFRKPIAGAAVHNVIAELTPEPFIPGFVDWLRVSREDITTILAITDLGAP